MLSSDWSIFLILSSCWLQAFDQDVDFSDFCLAYIFTYLDFDNGTAGLANMGAVCRPKNNTGFITLLNHGRDRNMEESIVTLAHELGHSLGAAHDDEVKYFLINYFLSLLSKIFLQSKHFPLILKLEF